MPAWAAAGSRAGFKSLPGVGAAAEAPLRAGPGGGGGGCCCSKMADEESLVVQPRCGPCAAADGAEPAAKRQRRDSEDDCGGWGAAATLRPGRGVGPAMERPGEAAHAERGEAAAGWSGADNGAGLRGLPRAEPPQSPQQQQLGRGEGAEAAPDGDAAELAIGCRRAQCSNGKAEAPAPHPGEDRPPPPDRRAEGPWAAPLRAPAASPRQPHAPATPPRLWVQRGGAAGPLGLGPSLCPAPLLCS